MEFCMIQESKNDSNVYEMSLDTSNKFNALENYAMTVFNKEIDCSDFILESEYEYEIQPKIDNAIVLNKNLKQSLNFVDGNLYYTTVSFGKNNLLSHKIYLYDEEEDTLLNLLDEFTQDVEEDIVNIWDRKFKKNSSDLFYGNVILDYIIYFYNFLEDELTKNYLQKTNFRLTDEQLENILFSLTTSNGRITTVDTNKNYFLKNKLLQLNNENYYLFNNTHKNGIITFTLYMRNVF